MAELNPLAFEDGRVMIHAEHTIDDVLRETAAKTREGLQRAEAMCHKLETAKTMWDADKLALLGIVSEVFETLVAAEAEPRAKDIETTVAGKAKTWRGIKQAMEEEYRVTEIKATDLKAKQDKCAENLRVATDSHRISPNEVASYKVLVNSHSILRELWSKHVQALDAAFQDDLRRCSTEIAGIHAADRSARRLYAEGLAQAQADFDKVIAQVGKLESVSPDVVEKSAALKRMFLEKVYDPLIERVRAAGVPDDFLRAAIVDPEAAASDPFCVRRCVAAEELLLMLPHASPPGTIQTQALNDARAKMHDLQRKWRAVQGLIRDRLLKGGVVEDVAAEVSHLKLQEASIKSDLDDAARAVEKLGSAMPTVDPDVRIDTTFVTEALKTCRAVKQGLDFARVSSEAFRHMVVAQHTRSVAALRDASRSEIRAASNGGIARMRHYKKLLEQSVRNADAIMVQANAVNDARAAQRIDAVSSIEMFIHGNIEQSVQLHREIVKLLVRRVQLRSVINAANLIVTTCNRLLEDLRTI